MKNPDRLYALVPAVYRQRDAGQGYPLQALLRVVAEQVDVVEADIAELYENWFIETCEPWVVPYIGDLLGYQSLNDSGEPSGVATRRQQGRERLLIPRRDVARTIQARRRKGTLALLDASASDVAGWPARAVEFFRLLGWTQNVHSPRLGQPRTYDARIGDTVAAVAVRCGLTVGELLWLNPTLAADTELTAGTRLLVGFHRARGGTADLRDLEALDRLDGPFDQVAHTVDVRRTDSRRTPGAYNIPSVGVFVWRLKAYSVGWTPGSTGPAVGTPAYCLEEEGPHCYTFSVLGNDTPLFNRPQPMSQPTRIAGELALPVPVRRNRFTKHPDDYYGPARSLAIWAADWPRKGEGMPIPASAIIAANLDRWTYRAPRNQVVVDPETGRIVFPVNQLPKQGVDVYYQYGFSAEIGGGEYDRPTSQPANSKVYRVGPGGGDLFPTLTAALARWSADKTAAGSAVIEITDSGVYTEKLSLTLDAGESLQIRAAKRKRPVIRLLDYMADQQDSLRVSGARGSRLTLDGLLITGRGLLVSGPERNVEASVATWQPPPEEDPGDLCDVTIRHCTLVPGWGLHCDCGPRRPGEPSLELWNTRAHVKVQRSIFGAVEVTANAAASDPVRIHVSDSLWDATSADRLALRGPDGAFAYAELTVVRTTVLGEIATHEIALAENSILTGEVCVARRQRGCVRFCYVPPGSRTPRRYECQPDLTVRAVADRLGRGEISAEESDAESADEALRVQPQFNSTRYGTPAYGQLAGTCAAEIATGADDRSEMGAFHDLYQPQRAANLRARLDDYTPAGTDAGVRYAT